MDQTCPSDIIAVRSDAQWHRLRSKLLITASRVACLLVDHPYTSARREYEIAIGGAERVDDIDPDLADLGLDAEAVILPRLLRLRPELKLRKNKALFVHRQLPFGGTPDFISLPDAEGRIAECWQAKCLHPKAFRRHWIDGPPEHVLLQHQAECLLTGARKGGVVALVRDTDWTTIPFDIEPHEGVMRAIADAISDFAGWVEERKAPPINFASDAAWVRERQRVGPAKEVRDMTGSNAWADACARWLAASEAEERAVNEKEVALAECIDLAGDAHIAHGHGFVLKRIEIKANPGKVITPAMVGEVIGMKRAHVRVEMGQEPDVVVPSVPAAKGRKA